MEKILLPAKTLEALGTRRVVISGGEPMLHPKIADILGYYKKLVGQVVIITNGYGLDRGAVEDLLRAGATGITISMDSVDSMESFLTRRTPPALHAKVLQNVAEIAGSGRKCELGINCTVSSVTANWLTVRDMLEFGESACLDFVKFQPVFDDGYVSANSPGLLLGPDDVDPVAGDRLQGGGVKERQDQPAWILEGCRCSGSRKKPASRQVCPGAVRLDIGRGQAQHMLLGGVVLLRRCRRGACNRRRNHGPF